MSLQLRLKTISHYYIYCIHIYIYVYHCIPTRPSDKLLRTWLAWHKTLEVRYVQQCDQFANKATRVTVRGSEKGMHIMDIYFYRLTCFLQRPIRECHHSNKLPNLLWVIGRSIPLLHLWSHLAYVSITLERSDL